MNGQPAPVLAVVSACLIGLLLPSWIRHLVPPVEPRDFYVDWMAARDLLAGRGLYRPLAGELAQLGLPGRFLVQYTTHAPTAGLFALPFAWLDYRSALLAWNVTGLVVLVAALRGIVRELGWTLSRTHVLVAVALAMAWAPLWELIGHGQSGLVLLGLLVVAWRALRRGEDEAAGMAIGLAAALKVYPGLLLAYLIICRRWRAVGAGIATAGGLAFVIALAAGPQALAGYVTRALPELGRWWSHWVNASIMGWASRLFMPNENTAALIESPMAAVVVIAVGTVVVVTTLITSAGTRRPDVDRGLALTLTAALLVSPVAWQHYFVVLLLPLAIVVSTKPPRRSVLVLMVLWLLMTVPPVQTVYRISGAGTAPLAVSLTVLSANFYGLAGFFVWQVRDWRRAVSPRAA